MLKELEDRDIQYTNTLKADLLCRLGITAGFLNETEDAIAALREAEDLYRRLGSSKALRCLYVRMDLLRERGKLTEAKNLISIPASEELEQQYGSSTRDEDKIFLGRLLHNMGIVYGEGLRDFGPSKTLLNRSLQYCASDRDEEFTNILKLERAHVYALDGDLDSAYQDLTECQQALHKIYSLEEKKNSRIPAPYYYNLCQTYLSDVLRRKGKRSLNVNLLQEASRLINSYTFPYPYFESLRLFYQAMALKDLYETRGWREKKDLEEAQSLLQKAMQFYQADRTPEPLCETPVLGDIRQELGRVQLLLQIA